MVTHLEALERVRDELDAWGYFETSESWENPSPEPITNHQDPDVPPHPLWLAVRDLQSFYPKTRLPKLSGLLDAWHGLLKYSRKHGTEDPDEQTNLAVKFGATLRELITAEIERVQRSDTNGRHPALREGPAENEGIRASAMRRLLALVTSGLSDDRIGQAIDLLQDDGLSVDYKLTRIDKIMPLPLNASAQKLADLVDCSKAAVIKTQFWNELRNRRGEETGTRKAVHRQRAKQVEPTRESSYE